MEEERRISKSITKIKKKKADEPGLII